MRTKMLGLLLVALVVAPLGPAPAQVTEDQVIDQVMALSSISGADDLLMELRQLAQDFVNDPGDYGGVGYSFTKSIPTIIHYRGTTVSTMAMTLPLLPGTITDTNTLKGKLAVRLKSEVTNYLLNQQYWDWEQATSNVPGATYLQPANPRISVEWQHHWNVGPYWEKMHALWAYAYYTSDWATIQNNWLFIKARYQEGYKGTDSQQRAQMISAGVGVYRNAINDLANGLIGYVRMAEYMNDLTAPQARAEAQAALGEVLNRLNVSWASCPITEGWDNLPTAMKGEWSPGYNLTPELGRWINDRARATALNRLDEAANAGELRGHWWAGYLNNLWKGQSPFHDEDAWGMPNLSHQLFLGRAWMLQEGASALRQVKPWHVVMGYPPEYRDMLYIRSLYALISRHATITWVSAN